MEAELVDVTGTSARKPTVIRRGAADAAAKPTAVSRKPSIPPSSKPKPATGKRKLEITIVSAQPMTSSQMTAFNTGGSVVPSSKPATAQDQPNTATKKKSAPPPKPPPPTRPPPPSVKSSTGGKPELGPNFTMAPAPQPQPQRPVTWSSFPPEETTQTGWASFDDSTVPKRSDPPSVPPPPLPSSRPRKAYKHPGKTSADSSRSGSPANELENVENAKPPVPMQRPLSLDSTSSESSSGKVPPPVPSTRPQKRASVSSISSAGSEVLSYGLPDVIPKGGNDEETSGGGTEQKKAVPGTKKKAPPRESSSSVSSGKPDSMGGSEWKAPPLPKRPGPGHPLFHYLACDAHGIAQFDYEAAQDDEISFKAGDAILLIERVNADWLLGRVGSNKGLCPQSFIKVVIPLPGDDQVASLLTILIQDETNHETNRGGEQAGEDEPLLGKKSSPIETSPADQVDAAGTGASPSAGSPVDEAAQKTAEVSAKKAEEEAAARKAAEEAAKKKAEEEAAKKAAEEAAKRKAEEEAAKAAAKKVEEEAAARKAAEEAAKKKAEEEAAKKAAEEAAKRKAEEEAAKAAAKKVEEEAARKAAEETAKRKAEEDAAKNAVEEAAKQKAEEEAAMAAAKKAEEEAARKAAEEAAKKKAEEDAAKRKAEEEAAMAATKKAEEEAAKKAAEEAAKKKAEEDAAKKAAEEAAKRKADEETAKAAAKRAEEEAARKEDTNKLAESAKVEEAAGELNKKAESRSKPRIEDDISRKSAEEDVQGREPGAYVAAEEATKLTPEEAAQMGAADEAAAKARAEEQAAAEKRAAEEEKAARLTAAEAAKKEAEESVKKRAAEELAAKIATEDAAQKAVEAEPAKLTGKAAKKAAKEAKKKREAEEKAAKKAAEEEAKKKAAEEKAAKKAAEAAAKKAAQEESARKAAEDLAAKKAAEEQAKAEEEAKKAAEEAAKKAEEEAARKAAEEAAKKKAEEEAAKKAAEEAAKKKAEEEAARRAEQEAAKQAEEAAKKAAEAAKKQATEPSAKKALEELVAKKTAEEEKAAEANGVSDQNPLQAEEKELKSFYLEAGNNVQPIPWMEDFKVDLDDVNMDLSIENQPRIRTPDAGKTIRIDEIFDPLTNIRGKKGEPPKRILIRGQPGIGKSTLCRKLAYDWSNPENETGTIKKFKYTFLIEGRHLGGDLKNAMAEQLLSQGFNDTPENLWKFVEDNQNDVLFIVDGYDEIDTSVKSDVGDLISKKILPQSTLVITSRPESTKEISRSVDKSLKVEGFNQEKSADFVNKHFHVTSPNTEHAPDVTENLVAALRRDKNLQQLAAYPLCNAYLCALWEDTEGDVPTTKSSLYDRLKIVVTRRYCLKQGVPLPAKSSDVPAQFRSYYRALGELAYNGVTNNKVLFDKPLVLHKVRDPRVLQMGLLLEEHSIARTKRHEYYRFPHKAFQEFFAAQYLSEMSEYVRSPTYPKLVKDRVWRDIVLFLPGALKQQPRDLIPLFKALSEYNNTRKSTYSDVGQYRLSLDTLFEAELQDTYSTIVAPSLPSLLTESHPIIEGVSSPTLQGLACVLKQNNIDVKEFRFGVWTEKYDQNCDTLTEALNDNQTVGKLVIAACNENDVVESVKDILARLAERNNTVKSLQIIDYSYKGPLKYDERIEMLRKVCTIEEIKIDSAARVWYPGLPQNPSEAQHTIRSTPMTPMSTD
uniref:SH3 domain-containing protein n=1 Tax=Branchiostoma floridae TaxID=7739 RepID=C3YGB4_BRAFL|eukprot:XP_002604624.1 hypothetical protein BRAFLDRAFT_92858 [Branchiostoma floridae]